LAKQFADFTDRTYTGDTSAFYFDNINAEDVKLLPLKQTHKSLLFISEAMDIFVCLVTPSKPSSQPIWLKI